MDDRRRKLDMYSLTDQMAGLETTQPTVIEKVVEVPVPYPSLAVADDGTIPATNFKVSRTGLEMVDGASVDDWISVGTAIFQIEGSLQLVIGDWLNYGVGFGWSIERVASELNRDKKTLQNWAWVASKFPHSLRRETLFFGHYSLLAARVDRDANNLIESTVLNNWTVAELRQHLLGLKRRKSNPDQLKKKASTYKKQFGSVYEKANKLPLDNRKMLADYLREIADKLDTN